MENASKALLIAAGVLVGLILISMIIIGYRQISSYYVTKEEVKASEQLANFNKQFIPYNRDDVRGTELISLVNKIIDFNSIKMNDTNEEKINISIIIPNNDTYKSFYYKYNETNTTKLVKYGNPAYTENNINTLLDVANQIESKYTQGMANKLAANISTVMGDNTRKTKRDLLVELKIMDDADIYANPNDYVNNTDILKYYQYVQFKRAHFDCTSMEYTNQGRIKKFTFRFNGTFE